MMEQILPPGVQDGEEADFRSKVLRIGGNEAQRLGDSTKKNVVEDLFVVQGNGGDWFRQREDDVKIGSIEEFGLAVVDPLSSSKGQTLATVAVSTGIVPDALVAALITLLHMTAESGRSADLDRVHDAALGSGQRVVVVVSVRFAVAAEDVRHVDPPVLH
jgi:hypothetical protein